MASVVRPGGDGSWFVVLRSWLVFHRQSILGLCVPSDLCGSTRTAFKQIERVSYVAPGVSPGQAAASLRPGWEPVFPPRFYKRGHTENHKLEMALIATVEGSVDACRPILALRGCRGCLCINFMQEWNVQSGARKSTISETPFADGDRIRSLLCIDSEGALLRQDFREDEEWNPEDGKVLAQWMRVFRRDTSEQDQQKEALLSTEEVFLQMVESLNTQEEADIDSDQQALVYLIALFLERKRILRALGRPDEMNRQKYRHIASKEEISIQTTSIDPQSLLRMADQLEKIF